MVLSEAIIFSKGCYAAMQLREKLGVSKMGLKCILVVNGNLTEVLN